jgi:hypothetical protein
VVGLNGPLPNIVPQTAEQQRLLTELKQSFLSTGRLTPEQAGEAYKQFGAQIPSAQLAQLWTQALAG